ALRLELLEAELREREQAVDDFLGELPHVVDRGCSLGLEARQTRRFFRRVLREGGGRQRQYGAGDQRRTRGHRGLLRLRETFRWRYAVPAPAMSRGGGE